MCPQTEQASNEGGKVPPLSLHWRSPPRCAALQDTALPSSRPGSLQVPEILLRSSSRGRLGGSTNETSDSISAQVMISGPWDQGPA